MFDERAVILLGQELAAPTLFLATTSMSLTIDVTMDCGLVAEDHGVMVSRLIQCTEGVHWRAPALARDIVDESLLFGGDLRRHRPKLCGWLWGELVAGLVSQVSPSRPHMKS